MKIVAIVTIYKPNDNNFKNINLIRNQVNNIVILNNTPDKSFKNLFIDDAKTIYIDLFCNLGLSAAFNKAMNLEVVKESDFIVFFDQDSSISNNHINTMVKDFVEIERIESIGALGPQFYEKNRNKLFIVPKTNNQNTFFKVEELITSSLMTKYCVLQKINFWNEDIFLDFADYDLCWRLNKNGLYSFITNNVTLEHCLGEGIVKTKLLGKKFEFSYSKPLREYYQNREAIKLLKKNYVSFRWKKNFLFNLLIRINIFCKVLPDSKQRKHFYFKGILDGILNISGEIKE